MKHIESILPEHAADEITRMLANDDATATAALTTLLHNATGCDIPHTSDLPASEVEELVPLCVSILRRHWKTPLTCLGDGSTKMSLADLLRQTIGDRVQGNEAWSIPAANANIPTAVAALRQRDMFSGLTLTLEDGTTMPYPDGLSFAQFFCTGLVDKVKEIVDNNRGWTMTKPLTKQFAATVENIQLGCTIMRMTKINTKFIENATNVKILELPYLRSFQFVTATIYDREVLINGAMIESVSTPELEEIIPTTGSIVINNCQIGLFVNCPNLKEWYAPKLSRIWGSRLTDAPLEKVVLGRLETDFMTAYNVYDVFLNNKNLIHFEIGAGTSVSLHMNWWNPTNVLSDSERLPIFLSNFKTYIAERLSGQGRGKTITLSQAVRDAIQQDPEIVSIITSKGWTISPAPTA